MATLKFPTIETITDVLPAIEGKSEFNVGDGSPYFDVVDYHLMDSHTFKDNDPAIAAIKRECRGLLFHKDGRIARRGFHKFFNIGETEETFADNIDLSGGYQLLEKLDGSMIAPFISSENGSVYWASMRGSYAYHERLAGLFDATPFEDLVRNLAADNATAIFEFCSQENRIVVDYAQPQMTLLAVRDVHSGRYHSRAELEAVTGKFGVPLVQPLDHHSRSAAELMNELSAIKNMEGAVLWIDGRPLAKFKGEWYLQLHKLLGHFKFEKDIARLVLSGNTDDLMGILNAPKRAALMAYQDALLAGVKQIATECEDLAKDVTAQNIDRKTFAVNYDASKAMKAFLFRHFDRFDQAHFLDDVIEKALSMTNSFGKWDSFKTSVDLKLNWDVDHLG